MTHCETDGHLFLPATCSRRCRLDHLSRSSPCCDATSPLLSQSVDWRGSQSVLASPPSGLGVPSVHGDPAGESDETHVSGKAGAGEKPRSIPAFYVPPAIHWRRCRQSPVQGKGGKVGFIIAGYCDSRPSSPLTLWGRCNLSFSSDMSHLARSFWRKEESYCNSSEIIVIL